MTPTALTERRGSHLVWEAWTDFGSVGAYPRAILGRSDKFSEGLVHLRLEATLTVRASKQTCRQGGPDAPAGQKKI